MKIRYFEKRPGAWHLDFRLADGKRARPYGGTTKAEAERASPAIVAQVLSIVPPLGTFPDRAAHAKAVPSITLDEAYRKALKVRESWITSKSKGTLQHTLDAIVATEGAGLQPTSPVAVLTRDFVRVLRGAWLLEPGKRAGTTLSRSTINHRLSMLTVLLEVADAPPHLVKHLSVKGTRRTRRISDEEVGKMLDWCIEYSSRLGAPAMGVMIQLGLATAAREGELLGLEWGDYRPRGEGGQPPTLTFRDTKNGDSRTVPITAACVRLLEARRGLPAPFADIHKDRLTRLWQDARFDIGLATDEEFVFHTLRHERISRWIDAGHSPAVVMALAGHNSITTTMIYTHTSLGAMDRVVNEGATA